jgi:Fe-S-cluster-containing hydrogenase component 2/bacterioferritin-associated ferredoxin
MAESLGRETWVPAEWEKRWEILKSKPGRTYHLKKETPDSGLFPVIRCAQEIPCDPCIHVCPKDMIKMKGDPIFGIPEVVKDECTDCTLCVAVCPGLAITLVDTREEGQEGLVTVPFELLEAGITEGDEVDAVDVDGEFITRATVAKVARRKVYDRTLLVTLRVPKETAALVAGFKIQDESISMPIDRAEQGVTDEDTIVCRCERVRAGDIRRMIRQGVRDLNQLKSLRCGMGACGGKTCQSLILRLFQEEGVDLCDVVPFTQRPLVAEVNLGMLAGKDDKG